MTSTYLSPRAVLNRVCRDRRSERDLTPAQIRARAHRYHQEAKKALAKGQERSFLALQEEARRLIALTPFRRLSWKR